MPKSSWEFLTGGKLDAEQQEKKEEVRLARERLAEFERKADPNNTEMQALLKQMREHVASLVRTSGVDNAEPEGDPADEVVDKRRGFYIP
ncbi:hypothetical protein PPROV_000814300 [Pycnococcus provasolii]|uniref:Uncharacterized protein n=1 Tax=Pycnococcus provasolii TaxID=41880 RepID=A0A830HR49_9CHLO|nr:hypothetical protein PPROV_000814300 [Pycnococcus provasolii]|mmetsp:Transcript_8894/g.20207  ORF Transcript_8894/g.20207 Transcript_8894/m.20207 type:complete len:90 (-) Transcript_8894:89-358(-)